MVALHVYDPSGASENHASARQTNGVVGQQKYCHDFR